MRGFFIKYFDPWVIGGVDGEASDREGLLYAVALFAFGIHFLFI
jgi:hypothetical protein